MFEKCKYTCADDPWICLKNQVHMCWWKMQVHMYWWPCRRTADLSCNPQSPLTPLSLVFFFFHFNKSSSYFKTWLKLTTIWKSKCYCWEVVQKKLISAIVCLKEPQNIEQKIQTCLNFFVKCPSPQYGIVSTFLSACPFFYPQYSACHVKVGKCIFSLQSVQIFAGKYGTGGQGTRAFPLHLHICSGGHLQNGRLELKLAGAGRAPQRAEN